MLSAWTNLLTKEQSDAINAAFEENRFLERAAIDTKFEGRTQKRRSTRGRVATNPVNVRSTSHPVQARSVRAVSPELQERINFLVDNRDLNLYPLSGFEKLQRSAVVRRKRMMADVNEQF